MDTVAPNQDVPLSPGLPHPDEECDFVKYTCDTRKMAVKNDDLITISSITEAKVRITGFTSGRNMYGKFTSSSSSSYASSHLCPPLHPLLFPNDVPLHPCCTFVFFCALLVYLVFLLFFLITFLFIFIVPFVLIFFLVLFLIFILFLLLFLIILLFIPTVLFIPILFFAFLFSSLHSFSSSMRSSSSSPTSS